MKNQRYLFALLFLVGCSSPESPENAKKQPENTPKAATHELSAVEKYYANYKDRTGESTSTGKVSGGTLNNGYLIPFGGTNFRYFDTLSYLSGRGFMNRRVQQTVLQTYDSLTHLTDVSFRLMECSNEHGGRILPHRTHQNGLSCDFMSPLLKNEVPSSELDNTGVNHYLMEFDNNGVFKEDSEFAIDFNTMALHLLILQQKARKNGLKIDKVILKVELKDNLFATAYGRRLQQSGIYFATSLSPMINKLHDDHYHVDFKLL